MGKPIFKSLGVITLGIGAVAICLVGYTGNNQKQYQQKIGYAETAISDQKQEMATLLTDTTALYSDESFVFLKPGITQEEIDNIANRLSMIKVSARDFGIESDELPEDAVGLADEKAVIENHWNDIKAKYEAQQQINELFVAPVSDWAVAINDVIIREDLTGEMIAEANNQLAVLEDDAWKAIVSEYLTYATAQYERVTALQEAFDAMLIDGVITNAVTYQGYLDAINSISQVRNEILKQKYTELAQLVASQMGYY